MFPEHVQVLMQFEGGKLTIRNVEPIFDEDRKSSNRGFTHSNNMIVQFFENLRNNHQSHRVTFQDLNFRI